MQVDSDVFFLDASSVAVIFVKYDGTVWSIGYNGHGIFGDGTLVDSYITPVQMQTINNAVRVSNLPYSTIILLDDSEISLAIL